MGIKTWFLGATMLFSSGSQAAKVTTVDNDFPEMKNRMTEMINAPLDEATQEYEKDSIEMEKTANPIERTVSFQYVKRRDNVLGAYSRQDFDIKMNSRFMQERQDALPYFVQHEKQHDVFASSSIIDSNGKLCLAYMASMGLDQAYEIDQIDEIGANIAEILLVRKNYIQGQKKIAASKKNVLKAIAQHPSKEGKKLQLALIAQKGTFSKQDNKYTVSQNGKVEATFDLTENPELQTALDAYITTKDDVNKSMDWEKQEYSWYFEAIASRKINPLDNSPSAFLNEMNVIGKITTSNWIKKYGKSYDQQCLSRARELFESVDGKDRYWAEKYQTNDANFQKVAQEGLTIGGFDFSKSVLSCLEVLNENNATIKKLKTVQAQIDGNKSCKEIARTMVNLGLNQKNAPRFYSRDKIEGSDKKNVIDTESNFLKKEYQARIKLKSSTAKKRMAEMLVAKKTEATPTIEQTIKTQNDMVAQITIPNQIAQNKSNNL
ncbi:MAG: hypothetical protein J6A33_00845 [Alphaproteobacteria bacterium]|nr:hypothetical protein [Alphaproteobacteria bacterium]